MREIQRLQSPCMIIYTVTVKLMFSVDWWNAAAIVGMAGKYMFAVKGLDALKSILSPGNHLKRTNLNKPAVAAIPTIHHFSVLVKILYGFFGGSASLTSMTSFDFADEALDPTRVSASTSVDRFVMTA